MVALAASGGKVAGPPCQLSTVRSPRDPKIRFAVILATDGRWNHLASALADAKQHGASCVLLKGQITSQCSGRPADWLKAKEIVEHHGLPTAWSGLASKDQWTSGRDWCSNWAGTNYVTMASVTRFDLFTTQTGQPLNRLHQELDGRFRIAAMIENPRTNRAFLPSLEEWSHQAETERCRWFITSGMSTEAFPDDVGAVILNLHRPTIDFMRMINGDRGHELAALPGWNVVCASPQRNRSGAYYLVSCEEDRVVLESRQFRGKNCHTDGIQEIRYDRARNLIAVANQRVPHPPGISTGLGRQQTNAPC